MGGCDCIRKKKEELSGLLVRLLEEGKTPEPDIPEAVSWPPGIEERINEHMKKEALCWA